MLWAGFFPPIKAGVEQPPSPPQRRAKPRRFPRPPEGAGDGRGQGEKLPTSSAEDKKKQLASLSAAAAAQLQKSGGARSPSGGRAAAAPPRVSGALRRRSGAALALAREAGRVQGGTRTSAPPSTNQFRAALRRCRDHAAQAALRATIREGTRLRADY